MRSTASKKKSTPFASAARASNGDAWPEHAVLQKDERGR
jgi:hypothetical protein